MTASVAVVVHHHADRLTADEEISRRHLEAFLGGYDVYLVVPEGSALELPGASVQTLPRDFFRDHRANSRLRLSRAFYEPFRAYEFILVYELDALVLKRELDEWCAREWDYVGAPWLREEAGRVTLTGVGNGGFSLRRVESCLRALERLRRPVSRARASTSFALRLGRRIVRPHAPVRQLLRDRYAYEDKVWGIDVPRADPSFRVAPADAALAFAFETNPRARFELNDRRLPFGCHKWRAHDPEFWEPYLLR